MSFFRPFALITVAILTITPLTSCGPKNNSALPTPLEIKAGVSVSHTPLNSADLTKIRDQEIIPLVEKGKITANEARAFMRAQKKRLNMPNQNKTEALDKILKQKGLE
jgi:hypothetical protein